MKYIFVLFLFFTSCFVFGQNQKQVDSLLIIYNKTDSEKEKINLLNNIGRLYGSINSKSALLYFDKAIELSKINKYPQGIEYGNLFKSKVITSEGEYEKAIKSLKDGIIDLKVFNYSEGIIELNTSIGFNYSAMHENDSAKWYFNNSIKNAKSLNYSKGLISAYLGHGDILLKYNDINNALINYVKIDSICNSRSIKTNEDCATALLNTGFIKSLMGERDQAEEYYNQALDYVRAVPMTREVYFNILFRLAILEKNKKNLEKSEKYFNDVIKFYRNTKNLPKLSSMLFEVSNLYSRKSQFERAENSINESIEISTKIKDSNRIAYALSELGYLKIKMKDFKSAPQFLKEAQEIALKNGNGLVASESTKRLSAAYYYNGNYKKAVEKYIMYKNICDSLDKIQRRNEIASIEIKYQTQKKEQEIALLTSKNELAEQQKKSQRNLLLGGIGITTIAGLFLFVMYRNRQKTNAKLKELDKIKSNFFANISHEFRTPLTLISNPIEETLEDESISDKKREQFAMAKRNSDRLLSLVNQLLDLSKIDAGQLNLCIQKGNVTQLISALSDSFSYQANQKQIQYTVDIKHNDKAVYYDKDAVDKIAINLLSNALKFTPIHGNVTCSAHINNDKLILEVKNTGKGLSKEELNQIFQRFYQTSEEDNGTGIGLALVKELVELHKGSITVDSELNTWTTFKVTLPVDKQSFKNEQFVDTSTKNINATTNTHLKVIAVDEDNNAIEDSELPILLIVEDNDDLRGLLKQTFVNDYKVITVNDGEKGINLAIEHIPDIIISDIMMPIKDGIELTETLKNDERTSHIPIVLLTAKAGDANELRGIEVGADDYMTKPFNSKILITKVSKLLETRQLLQNRYSQELILTPKDIAVTNLDEAFLEKVQEVLNENLVESSFSVEGFSEAVGMSRMQLHRKIKALTGLSASEFIRSQRLKLAAVLLKKSDINISQIGYTVGFNDHSYFTKCFKEAYNCTPTEYAKRN